ncbi:MAG: transposase, partial [Bacteroidota bacterium]
VVFKSEENYDFFLWKYKKYFCNTIEILAYCLMPTHFHLLVFIQSNDTMVVKNRFGILLSSYTKAINNQYKRHGSLFQLHTKAKLVDSENYLMTLAAYIHQNPIRAGLTNKLEDWIHTSYRDYIGLADHGLIKKDIVLQQHGSVEEFKIFSKELLLTIDSKYWI